MASLEDVRKLYEGKEKPDYETVRENVNQIIEEENGAKENIDKRISNIYKLRAEIGRVGVVSDMLAFCALSFSVIAILVSILCIFASTQEMKYVSILILLIVAIGFVITGREIYKDMKKEKNNYIISVALDDIEAEIMRKLK